MSLERARVSFLPKEEFTCCEFIGSEIRSLVLGVIATYFNHHARFAPQYRNCWVSTSCAWQHKRFIQFGLCSLSSHGQHVNYQKLYSVRDFVMFIILSSISFSLFFFVFKSAIDSEMMWTIPTGFTALTELHPDSHT